jgi:hypothetical protein
LFFLLTIVFSVFLPIVASDGSFGIVKCDKMTNKNTTPSEHLLNLGERENKQHEIHKIAGVNSGTPEGLAVPAPLVAPSPVM